MHCVSIKKLIIHQTFLPDFSCAVCLVYFVWQAIRTLYFNELWYMSVAYKTVFFLIFHLKNRSKKVISFLAFLQLNTKYAILCKRTVILCFQDKTIIGHLFRIFNVITIFNEKFYLLLFIPSSTKAVTSWRKHNTYNYM